MTGTRENRSIPVTRILGRSYIEDNLYTKVKVTNIWISSLRPKEIIFKMDKKLVESGVTLLFPQNSLRIRYLSPHVLYLKIKILNLDENSRSDPF